MPLVLALNPSSSFNIQATQRPWSWLRSVHAWSLKDLTKLTQLPRIFRTNKTCKHWTCKHNSGTMQASILWCLNCPSEDLKADAICGTTKGPSDDLDSKWRYQTKKHFWTSDLMATSRNVSTFANQVVHGHDPVIPSRRFKLRTPPSSHSKPDQKLQLPGVPQIKTSK